MRWLFHIIIFYNWIRMLSVHPHRAPRFFFRVGLRDWDEVFAFLYQYKERMNGNFFWTYNLLKFFFIIFTRFKSSFNIIRHLPKNIGINRADPVPIGSGRMIHSGYVGLKKTGLSRSRMKNIRSSQAARMPTLVLNQGWAVVPGICGTGTGTQSNGTVGTWTKSAGQSRY